jgi:hypothetical protein
MWRALAPCLAAPLILAPLGVVLGAHQQAAIFAIVACTVVLISLVFAWEPLRMRRVRVEVHAFGVAVWKGRKRDVVRFDDVNEVWLSLDHLTSPFGRVARVKALRLVDHSGTSYQVPAALRRGDEIVRWVIRQCSDPLVSEALRAFRAGEPLTFGKVRLDRSGIRESSWSVEWRKLRLVRFAPGRISLFRWQTVFPCRTILLDRIPHPTVFAKVMAECGVKHEVYDPLGTPTQ